MPRSKNNVVDVLIGRNIRLYRRRLELSQTELGARIGVSLTQIQKYENGTDRIAASRLFEASKVLNVPINAFFEVLPRGLKGRRTHSAQRSC